MHHYEEIHIPPVKFLALLDIMRALGETENNKVAEARELMLKFRERVEKQTEELSKADAQMAQEIRRSQLSRKRRAFEENDPDEELMGELARTARGHTFIGVVLGILNGMLGALNNFEKVLKDVTPDHVYLPDKRDFSMFSSEDMRDFMLVQQINGPAVSKFVNAVESIDDLRNSVVNGASQVALAMDGYYQTLLKRHSVEGVEIHHNPVTTDIAINIFENIDMHGEIEDGRKPDEISAYSQRKAVILAETIKSQSAMQFVSQPDDFIDQVIRYFNDLWNFAEMLLDGFVDVVEKVMRITDSDNRRRAKRFRSRNDFERELELLRDLNPNSVVYKDKTGLLSAEERFLLKFRNETLRNVTRRIINQGDSSQGLVEYILSRKAELHKYFTEENSFYVCKIGTGNQFRGEAPGQLEVIPGAKPSVNLDEIIGSGFDEIRDFIDQVETSGKWHDLFVATSPSRTADKSNVLLIGPQGCGKTEAMRAVGADTKSVAIFAQGSDFVTCWAGEAQKNPKRLFEQAVRIQRESNRHVYILIDEIDQVLHTDHTSSGAHFNLTREFQILMDGVVAYPSLSVWGATNHPERIPMPMMRRFSKALIVGELDLEDRVRLLKHYTSFMPVKGFDHKAWYPLAYRLNGATGDIIRKVIDPIWRSKMRSFTENEPERAEKLQDWLNRKEKFDVRRFNAGQRAEFHAMLGEHVFIEPSDIEASIDSALNNMAVLNEIQTAKATYATAHHVVDDLRRQQTGKDSFDDLLESADNGK